MVDVKKLNLDKPLVVFDLETTGVDVVKDRIVQIAAHKIMPDGTVTKKNVLINPMMPIPTEAMEVHGITDEMVADKPRFDKFARSMSEWFSGCYIGGYNSDNFDIPLLSEEMHRCGIVFPDKDSVRLDMFKIEKKYNSHKLGEVYKRLFGEELDGAHDADVDVTGTVKVMLKQIENYGLADMSVDEIIDSYQGDKVFADISAKFYIVEGDLYWNFGKNRDKMVIEDKGYVNWFQKQDFPTESKTVLNEYLESLR